MDKDMTINFYGYGTTTDGKHIEVRFRTLNRFIDLDTTFGAPKLSITPLINATDDSYIKIIELPTKGDGKMRQSRMTGEQIFNNMKELLLELDEAIKAKNMVADSLGKDNTAYAILDEQLEKKKKELEEFEHRTFTVDFTRQAL